MEPVDVVHPPCRPTPLGSSVRACVLLHTTDTVEIDCFYVCCVLYINIVQFSPLTTALHYQRQRREQFQSVNKKWNTTEKGAEEVRDRANACETIAEKWLSVYFSLLGDDDAMESSRAVLKFNVFSCIDKMAAAVFLYTSWFAASCCYVNETTFQ